MSNKCTIIHPISLMLGELLGSGRPNKNDENIRRMVLTRKLASIAAKLEAMGETELGGLNFRQATKFHKMLDHFRDLLDDLMKEIIA